MPKKADEKKVKRTSKIWKNQIWLIAVRKQNVSSVQTSHIKRIELFLILPYNKHLINRAKSVCMGES